MKPLSRSLHAIAIAIAIAIACLPVGHPAAAQQDSLAERSRAIKLELRCPVCEGSSIEESPSQQAREMKAIVDEQLAAGKSEDEIKDYFVSKYGEWILLDPPARGINLLMYILPLILVTAGAFFVYRTAKKWTQA